MSKSTVKTDSNGVVIFTKSHNHPSVGLDFSKNIIQHKDFSYDNDRRDFVIVDAEKEDRDAYIQSFADETGVYNIMRMYAKTQDASLLNKKQGFYGDISNLPENDLNPAARTKAAEEAVKALSKKLGKELTADELLNMDNAQLVSMLTDIVDQRVAAASKVEKKEGEE